MNFMEIAQKRYACRNYQEKKVEPEKLDKILAAGRIAPTGGNCQPQQLIVVQKESGLVKISKGARIFGAPLAIIVCCDKEKVWTRPCDGKKLTDIDASIVTDHMMLQATELGLDSVWICHFEPNVIKAEFALPDHVEVVNILAIGYAAGAGAAPDRHAKTRKPLSEYVVYQ